MNLLDTLQTIEAAGTFKLEPPAKDSATGKFLEILSRYSRNPKMPMMEGILFSPQRWYNPRELTIIFKQFRGNVERMIDADKKEINAMKRDELGGGQGEAKLEVLKAEKLKGRVKTRIADLETAKDLLPGIIKDFKTRLANWEKKEHLYPKELEQFKKDRPDLGWVENPEKYLIDWSNILFSSTDQKKLTEKTEQGLVELQKKETPKAVPKEKGTGMVEFTKFKDVENILKSIKGDLATLADKLSQALIPPGGSTEKHTEKVAWEVDTHKEFADKFKKKFPDVKTDSEAFKKPYDLFKDLKFIRDEGRATEEESKKADKLIVDLLDHIPTEAEEKTMRNFVKTVNEETIEPLKTEPVKDIQKLREDEQRRLSPDPNTIKKLVTEYEEFLKDLREKFEDQVKDAQAKADEKAKEKAKENLTEAQKLEKAVKEEVEAVPLKSYPASFLAAIIATNLQDFKKLHTMYHGVLWARSRVEEKELGEHHKEFVTKESAEEEKKETPATPTSDIESFHKQVLKSRQGVVDDIRHFVSMDIHSKESYKKADAALKSTKAYLALVNDFFAKLISRMSPEMIKVFLKEQGVVKTGMVNAIVESLRRFAAELGEKAKEQAFDKLFNKEKVLEKLRENKDTFKYAREELEEIYDWFKIEYVKPRLTLLTKSKELGITPQEFIAQKLPAVLEAFTKTWALAASKIQEVGTKTVEKHKYLSDWLDKLVKSGKYPEMVPSRHIGITEAMPSRDALLNYIEKNWMTQSAQFDKALRDLAHLKEEEGAGGGGGGSKKTKRKKEPKEIAQGMKEVMKHRTLESLLKFLSKEISPKDLVDEVIEGIGEGLHSSFQFDILDKGTVIDGIVSILRDIPNSIRSLRVVIPGVSGRGKGDVFTPPDMSKKKFEEKKAVETVLSRVFGPQHSPGLADPGEKTKEPGEHLKGLIDVGPWRARAKGYDLVLGGTPEKQLHQVMTLKHKIDELHKELELVTSSTIEQIYPMGLLDSIEQLNKELGKGVHAPIENTAEKEFTEKMKKKFTGITPGVIKKKFKFFGPLKDIRDEKRVTPPQESQAKKYLDKILNTSVLNETDEKEMEKFIKEVEKEVFHREIFSFPTQISHNVAARALDIKVLDDEFEAIIL